jgi:threonine dehydrogenase-like Zn-dependent dehydrogenase
MYFDTKPCGVCGSDVELRGRREPSAPAPDGPVGPPDGVVGEADSTVDERVCTNADCPTNAGTEATRPSP